MTKQPPEYNVTAQDFSDRAHFRYEGPIIDIHSHVVVTRPGDPKSGPPSGEGPDPSTEQAETMLQVAGEYGIVRTLTMCYPDDIPMLRQKFNHDTLGFNGLINKQKIDDPDESAYETLDRFLEYGIEIVKFWSAPRGRERGLFIDAPWRIEAAKRAIKAGIRVFMVHVADPDTWFRTVYSDASKFGTKDEQYIGLERMLQMFPDVSWIAAHMGGDPERPDHLEELLSKYPNLHIDTSATKWQVREVSVRKDAIRALICRYPDRFLFGSDLVTRHTLAREHYESRYWCQRTLWESDWEGRSPIFDPDFKADKEAKTPMLCGLNLPDDVLRQVYYENSERLLASNQRHPAGR